jgi:hypothetical protein
MAVTISMSDATEVPGDVAESVTGAVVYELDRGEWTAAPIPPALLSPKLRVLCELWRAEHPSCRFAMLLTLAGGQYTLKYLPDLGNLARVIDSINHFMAALSGATVPWRLEILPASRAALSALVLFPEDPTAPTSVH